MLHRPGVLAAAVVVFLVLSPAVARADVLSTLGWDPEATATAGSNVSIGRSIGVVFANPALLPEVEPRVHVGFLAATPRLQARLLPKPPRSDVPRSVFDSTVATDPGAVDRPLPTAELAHARRDTVVRATDTRMVVGFATGFGLERFRFAALAAVPMGGNDAASIRTHYDDEREGHFSNRLWMTRFGEWDRVASVIAGAGYRIDRWISVGVGVQLAATALARIKVYVPDAAVQDHAESNLETDVATSWRPILGVRAKCPRAPIAVGATFRGESSFRVDGASEVQLWNDHEADPNRTIPRRTTQVFPMVFGWEPMEVALGAGWEGERADVRLAATWERWSRYVDHHGQRPEDAAAIPGVAVDRDAYRFRDVVTLSGAVTAHPARWLEITIGGAYRPTPVPAQVGRTSFVDADVVSVALGERARFELAGRAFELSLGFQLSRMLPRTTHKDPAQTIDVFPDDARTLRGAQPMPEAAGLQTHSPGFPGYRVEGFVLASTLALAHRF